MAQVSKRQRQLRRVKRERSQLRRAIGVQQNQLSTVVKMLMDTQTELKKLKPPPSYTITTLADDVEPDTAEEIAALKAEGPFGLTDVHSEENHDNAASDSDPS